MADAGGAPEPGTRPKLGSWKSEHKHAEDMARLTAAEISKLLRELALRLELEGGNPYRARAYSRAADNLALSPVPVDQLIGEGRLKEIPGVGDALAAVITRIYETGDHPNLAA